MAQVAFWDWGICFLNYLYKPCFYRLNPASFELVYDDYLRPFILTINVIMLCCEEIGLYMDLLCRFLEFQFCLFTFNHPRVLTTWSDHQRYFGPLQRQQKADGDTWCRTHWRRQFESSGFEPLLPNGRLRRFLWKAQVRLWSPLVKLLRAEIKEKSLILLF